MKKIFLLLAGGMIVFGADAQYVKRDASVLPNTKIAAPKKIIPDSRQAVVVTPLQHHNTNRTTSIPFYTEDFGSGSSGVLPAGWTTGILSGPGTWHWANWASSSTYSIGTIHSTTASNGWMIFDSDSLGGGVISVTPSGWLQSPLYNCTAHTTVRLTFEEYYRSFNDSCSVWVSTSPTFATYTDYPVALNDALAPNASTANAATVHINISTAAAGHSVYIRFVYYGPAGGGYSWMIDDLNIAEMDPHDVGVSGSFIYEPDATAYNSSLFTTPMEMVDSIYPITQLTNYGDNAETNVAVNAQIFQNGTSVYNHNSIYASLPLNSLDSLVQGYAGYFPNDTGSYICAVSTTVPSDADATNNTDTVLFHISDTLWMQNQGNITGSYYCHEAGATLLSSFEGTRFDVPSNSPGDTVSGFGVVFDPISVPTSGSAKVSVQLYSIQQSSSGWTYEGTSVARAITSADISSVSSVVWAYFGIDLVASGGVSAFILQPGTTYAAMIQVNGVTTDLAVDATATSNATGYAGYFGQFDTSYNDGATNFGASTTTGNGSGVPMVSMYFGHISGTLSIQNINANAKVNAYPSPTANELNVSYSVVNATNVSVSLTNTIGQTLATQNMGNVTSGKAVFNTASLPDGVYIYTLQANGERTTGHVVIAH